MKSRRMKIGVIILALVVTGISKAVLEIERKLVFVYEKISLKTPVLFIDYSLMSFGAYPSQGDTMFLGHFKTRHLFSNLGVF